MIALMNPIFSPGTAASRSIIGGFTFGAGPGRNAIATRGG